MGEWYYEYYEISEKSVKTRFKNSYNDIQCFLAGDLTLTNIPNSMCTLVIRKYVNNIYNSSIFYNVVYFSFKETLLVLFLSLYLSSFGSGLVLVGTTMCHTKDVKTCYFSHVTVLVKAGEMFWTLNIIIKSSRKKVLQSGYVLFWVFGQKKRHRRGRLLACQKYKEI